MPGPAAVVETFRGLAPLRAVVEATGTYRCSAGAGTKIARVAAARKLAEICWKRLLRSEREQQGVAVDG